MNRIKLDYDKISGAKPLKKKDNEATYVDCVQVRLMPTSPCFFSSVSWHSPPTGRLVHPNFPCTV